MEKKDKRMLAAGVALLILTAVLQAAARQISGFATWYAHYVYPVLVGVIGRISGGISYSVVELELYLLIVCGIAYGVRHIRRPWRLCAGTVLLCGALLFAYTVNCGINYYAMPFSTYAGIETGMYTKEELRQLCEYLVKQVNAMAEEGAGLHYNDDRAGWRAGGVEAMRRAAERSMSKPGQAEPGQAATGRNDAAQAVRLSCLGGYYPRPKEVMVSQILSVQQLCGVYSPFTIEANFNGDMPDYNIPHTICHELSHLKGFMREDEANFIGYLACISSDHPAFRYSGYLTGWVYAGNALAKADWESYQELRRKLDARAEQDLMENNAFWDRYEGAVAEVSNQWNDAYLKMNDQEDGVKSYGRVVDLMLAYYKGGGK